MSENLNEHILNQVFLMSYDKKKTLSENKNILNSKKVFIEGFPDNPSPHSHLDDELNQSLENLQKNSDKWIEQSETKRKESELNDPNRYPNYCKFKEHTSLPPENAKGAEGIEAIPPNYCYYKTVGGGIFLNQLTLKSIQTMTLARIERWADKTLKEGKGPNLDKETLMTVIAKLVPLNEISGFIVDGKEYHSQLRSENKGPWYFGCFINNSDNTDCYKNPELVDMRNDWDYIVDEWGDAIQIGLALVTAFIPLGGWAFAVEIAIELTVGVIVAQRAFEKGENISGSLSILFGMLPMLKAFKSFRGISAEAFEKLSKEIAEAGLKETSSVAEYISFYNKLDEEGKMIMNQMFKQDEITRDAMIKELTQKLSDEATSKAIISTFDDLFKKAAGMAPAQMIAYRLPIFKRLWARELRAAGALLVIQEGLKLTLGETLDSEDTKSFEWINLAVPEESQVREEMLSNFITQIEEVPEVIDTLNVNPTLRALRDAVPNAEELSDHAAPIIDSILVEVYKEEGLNYYDMNGQPKSTDTISVVKSATPENINAYKELGWKFCREVPFTKWPKEGEMDRYKTINDTLYILVNE